MGSYFSFWKTSEHTDSHTELFEQTLNACIRKLTKMSSDERVPEASIADLQNSEIEERFKKIIKNLTKDNVNKITVDSITWGNEQAFYFIDLIIARTLVTGEMDYWKLIFWPCSNSVCIIVEKMTDIRKSTTENLVELYQKV